MAVKVVQGLVGKPQTDQTTSKQAVSSANQAKSIPSNAQISFQASRTVANQIASSEAVVSTLRSSRSSGVLPGEKIRDEREAKRVAEDVADQIREGEKDTAVGVHAGLDNIGSGGSLLQH